MGIIHRDLKPENILIDEKGTIKISDFGVSILSEDPENDLIKGTEGTRHYCSPECLGLTGQELYSGKASDIWSLGVCLYVYTFLKLPFSTNITASKVTGPDGEETTQATKKPGNIMNLFEMIKQGNFTLHDREISENLSKLINELLKVDASERIKID